MRVPASTQGRLAAFLAVTFALAWLVPGLVLLAGEATGCITVDLSLYSPLYYLGVWSPAIAALGIAAWNGGASGLQAFVARVVWWRASWRWYLGAIVLLPSLYLAAAVLWWLLGHPALSWPQGTWVSILTVALLTATAGPVEEIGWRGFALPLLQQRLSPLTSALVLGLVWGIWHLPVFVVGGFDGAAFFIFLLQIVAVSIILTAFFNASGGCIPLMMLMHWLTNFPYPWEGRADLMLPQTLLLVSCAVLLVAAFGRRLRETSMTRER